MALSLQDVVLASAAVAATPRCGEKIAALAGLLARASPDEVGPAVRWLSGELTQRQIGVGWAALRDPPSPATEATLAVEAVERAFARIGATTGAGSQAVRREALVALLAAADAGEQAFLVRLLVGDLRQGAQAGVMAEAVARAASLPPGSVRAALSLDGDLAAVAAIALRDGAAGLGAVRLRVGRPVSPMLAATAADVADAVTRAGGGGPVVVDAKLDGARVQVHRDGDEVAVFTRTLDDVTARLPEIAAFARALPVTAVVLDAEAIALRADGRPEPFQVTASRFGRTGAREVPLTALAFDVLHLDGEDLLARPLRERAEALAAVVPAPGRVDRAVADDLGGAQEAMDAALAAGHEGVMVKALEGPYAAGRRATGWLKVKPVHTFDLVVLAAEWGHGRRRGKLSNLHLGARDGVGLAMVGKTFKGLTDEMLVWQTERLLELEAGRDAGTVRVRPELVVEIAVDGVQRSTRYASGAALRFARVKRFRPDKTVAEADTLATVLALRDLPG